MFMFYLMPTLMADPLTIQLDRAIFGAFVTVAIFFATHVFIAIKWGARVSSDVRDLLKRVGELSSELHGIRDAVVKFNVTDAQVMRNMQDINDLELRVRKLEHE